MYDPGQFDKFKRYSRKGPIFIGLISVGIAGFLLFLLSGQEQKEEVREQVQITADSTRQADSLLQTEPDDTLMAR